MIKYKMINQMHCIIYNSKIKKQWMTQISKMKKLKMMLKNKIIFKIKIMMQILCQINKIV